MECGILGHSLLPVPSCHPLTECVSPCVRCVRVRSEKVQYMYVIRCFLAKGLCMPAVITSLHSVYIQPAFLLLFFMLILSLISYTCTHIFLLSFLSSLHPPSQYLHSFPVIFHSPAFLLSQAFTQTVSNYGRQIYLFVCLFLCMDKVSESISLVLADEGCQFAHLL